MIFSLKSGILRIIYAAIITILTYFVIVIKFPHFIPIIFFSLLPMIAFLTALLSLFVYRDTARPRTLKIVNALIIVVLIYSAVIDLGPRIAGAINDSRVAQCPRASVVLDEIFGVNHNVSGGPFGFMNYGKRCDDPSINPIGARIVTFLSPLIPEHQPFAGFGRFFLAVSSLFILSLVGFIMEIRHKKKSGQSVLRALWSPSFPVLLSMILPFLFVFSFVTN